jgi:ubiquinone/menaquinone biosynthesis C-methylase UbiE
MPRHMKTVEHDNSIEMWHKYYESDRGKLWFEKMVHFAREKYFGNAFMKTVMMLGGKAESYLETGVGTAQTLERLQQTTHARCVGVEKTPNAQALGKDYAKHCEIILGDALKLPLPDKSFDVSYSLGLFEHFSLEEQKRFLSEQARVTKKRIVFSVPLRVPHMMFAMWFNKNIRGLKGVWADDELFNKRHFMEKFPGLPFLYHKSANSFYMMCWFVLKPEDVEAYLKN